MGDDDRALKDRLKALVVQCARLKIAATDLKDDQPLFDPQKGLGLDSIDVLEIVVNVEKAFGVTIPDKETGQRVLQSIDTLAAYLREQGVGRGP